MSRLLRAAVIAIVLLLVAGGAATFMALRTPTPGSPVSVEVPSGASTERIGQILRDSDVIGSVFGFRLMAKVRGLDGKIQAGRYELNKDMGVRAALDALAKTPDEKFIAVTVPEGFTVRQIAARVAQRTHIGSQAFLNAAASVRAQIQPAGSRNLEGFLFPETFQVGEKDDAAALVRRMVSEFEKRTSTLDWSVAESAGLSRYQALIIASLVEREAKVDEDRPKVAAVIYNRLKRGMRLQIDITALYDAPEHKVPTRRDLRRESPYNTYLIDGLPPTPIANPGLGSIRAALAPSDADWIYYVVIDPSGRHGFTSSPQEFERMKRLRPAEVRGG